MMKIAGSTTIRYTITLFLLVFCGLTQAVNQTPIRVAVASNFKNTLIEIARIYEAQTGQSILISSASTGILFNQIRHGAPFDLFLSADSERAQLIEQSAFGVTGSGFTYAQGLLAFWAPQYAPVAFNKIGHYTKQLAIANPKLAPYGLAAMQSLKTMELWSHFRYVQGANISQTYQFVESGNVAAGIVAYAQLLQNKQVSKGSYVLLPISLYDPILQQGVVLSASIQPQEVQKFADFLISNEVQALIREKGYF